MNRSLFPPPASFAEGQRLIYGWLAAAAGIFCGLAAAAMVGLLMWGGWSAAEEQPLLALLPGACAATRSPQPIPALPEQRQCPAYPLPPTELLKPPVKTDFLTPTS